jgi:dCMP deaminase
MTELILERPTVDEWAIGMAHSAKTRSEDLFYKCGCIFVHTDSKIIISTGFNGLVPDAPPEMVDRANREARRPYMLHAEKNAILNCNEKPKFIGHCTAYITNKPCFPCVQDMVAFGIRRIVFELDDLSPFYDKDDAFIQNLLKYRKDIELVQLKR